MKKQFEILEELYLLTKEVNERISVLKQAEWEEFLKIKNSLINAYDNESDTLYLVKFSYSALYFYKASKDKLTEVFLSWFNNDKPQPVIKNYDEAKQLLETYKNPTNCEIRSYIEFGYFHDIQRRYDRIDWITDSIQKKEFLYEIEKNDFVKSLQVACEFHSK